MSDKMGDILNGTRSGEFQALARLLTFLEKRGAKELHLVSSLFHSERLAYRIGITGPPGAGKSTLIGRLITEFRKLNLKVGVIAVDPSSPLSRGAILGDRLRYSEHFLDDQVFIRSLASRGSLGGLSVASYLMAHAFDYAGFDVLLIETVGVGQTEFEVMNVADFVSVVLVPESGDSIQGMKAGLFEIADLFIVNKSDRPGAEAFSFELESALQIGAQTTGKPQVPIELVSAIQGNGLDQMMARFLAAMNTGDDWKKNRVNRDRLQSEAKAILRETVEREIQKKTMTIANVGDFLRVIGENVSI